MKYFIWPLSLMLFFSCSKIEDIKEPGKLVPKTVSENLNLPRLEVNGTLLHAESFGNPTHPLIIVLHGGPGGDYRSLIKYKELAFDGYYVVFFDQRGAGLSERVSKESITMSNYLKDLDDIIDHYTQSDTQQVNILGHSWGAMYATMYINAFPARINKAVYVEPGGFTSDEIEDFFRQTFSPEIMAEWMNNMSWIDNAITSDSHIKSDYKRAMLVPNVTTHQKDNANNPPPGWRWGGMVSIYLPQDQKEFDWTTNLHQFQNEVLFINSEWNTVQTLEHQQGLAAHYPVAEVITVNDVGHDVLYQKYDECKTIILNFLK